MDNIYFYPTISEQLMEDAGCYATEFNFSYYIEGTDRKLTPKGKNIIRLEDDLETWKIENDGLRVYRDVVIEYPRVFKGGEGVACRDAEIGICIIWYNRALKQMGYIKEARLEHHGNREKYVFAYEFQKGLIKGDLVLDTVVYIKKPAAVIQEDETNLINEAGVTVGTIDSVTLNFENLNMDFPIIEVNNPNQPLWWLELENWEDPRKDPFNEDYVCLYLNSAYSYCPKIGASIKNIELLIEIITTAYLMVISEIDARGYLNDTLNDVELEQGSISKIIYYFYTSCSVPLKYNSFDELHKTIHQNIEKMLRAGDDV